MKKFKALKEGDSFDFSHNSNPRCPHCGKEIDVQEHELWELYKEDDHEITCPYCDEDFKVASTATYSFCTGYQDEDEDEGGEG